MVTVPRAIESSVTALLSYFPAVSMVGPRQVGKTTLAKQMMRQLTKPTLYLDLEVEADLARLTSPTLFLQPYQDSCVVSERISELHMAEKLCKNVC